LKDAIASADPGAGFEPSLKVIALSRRFSRYLVPTTPSVSLDPIAEPYSEARVRYAALKNARPCFLRAVLQPIKIATDGSAGNQIQLSFFVLQKTRTRWK